MLRALAQPEDKRAAALADCMKNWRRLMRHFGYKPNLDTSPGKDGLFCDFAFEIALAACAYDVDDRSSNTHPYYPRDLFEYHRANIRNTRDAWRAIGVGAGVAIVAPPPPSKADLSKSKRKGLARWVELVCDGDVGATEAVLEVVGKPKKIKDTFPLLQALLVNKQAILADLRDDDSVEAACADLAGARGWGEFFPQPGPPFGVTRCLELLKEFTHCIEPHGYYLLDMESGDDAWKAILVRQQYHQELLNLGAELGIVAG